MVSVQSLLRLRKSTDAPGSTSIVVTYAFIGAYQYARCQICSSYQLCILADTGDEQTSYSSNLVLSVPGSTSTSLSFLSI